MFNANKYLIIALLGFAIAAYSGWQGYKFGRDKTNSIWLEKENAQIIKATNQIKSLYEEARAKESLAAVELSNKQNELSEAQHEIDNQNSLLNQQRNTIASLRWGASALRTSESEISAAAASTRQCDGETITELSGELFEAFYKDFGRCDKVVEQLTACQEVIKIDRQITNDNSE